MRSSSQGTAILFTLLKANDDDASFSEPIHDDITFKLTAAWRRREAVHCLSEQRICVCGRVYPTTQYWVPGPGDGLIVPARALHLVVHHRNLVSEEDLDLIASIKLEMIRPTHDEHSLRVGIYI